MMNNRDLIATAQYCIRVDLATVPIPEEQPEILLYDRIQYLFQALFQASRFDPDHLLLSPEDHLALDRGLMRSSPPPWRDIHHLIGLEPGEFGRPVTQVRNLTTGKIVYVASLPDLEHTKAMVGFFPIAVQLY